MSNTSEPWGMIVLTPDGREFREIKVRSKKNGKLQEYVDKTRKVPERKAYIDKFTPDEKLKNHANCAQGDLIIGRKCTGYGKCVDDKAHIHIKCSTCGMKWRRYV